MEIQSLEELVQLRKRLTDTEEKTRQILLDLFKEEGRQFLMRLKFERLGCHPLDPDNSQNVGEQIDLHGSYLAAIDGLEILMGRHPGERWLLRPGHDGSGHDIQSVSGEIAAEVFSAVRKD